MTWALILAWPARHIVQEEQLGSQRRLAGARSVANSTAGYWACSAWAMSAVRLRASALAFGMKIIAWSQNLTQEIAAAAGASLVTRDELFRQADVVSIRTWSWSKRTRGLVGAADLALTMKPTSWLINTSRAGPSSMSARSSRPCRRGRSPAQGWTSTTPSPCRRINPFRTLDNVLATPHIGYVGEDLYRTFYIDAAASIGKWLDEA